jgi:hypothetical protein
MSCWLCSPRHFNSIVRAAEAWGEKVFYVDRAAQSWQEVLDILVAENCRSVNYRYQTEDPVPTITYNPRTPLLPPLVILKACNSLDYQSCETSDWETTRAFAILQKIKDHAIRELPGYDKAEGWSLD